MRGDEARQQELEQQEQEETVAYFTDEDGNETKFHIYADEDVVFVNLTSCTKNFSLRLEKQQAEKMQELLTNALRRAK